MFSIHQLIFSRVLRSVYWGGLRHRPRPHARAIATPLHAALSALPATRLHLLESASFAASNV